MKQLFMKRNKAYIDLLNSWFVLFLLWNAIAPEDTYVWCGETVVSGWDKPNKELSLSHDRDNDLKWGMLKTTQTNDIGQASDYHFTALLPLLLMYPSKHMGKGVKSLHHKTGFILLVSASLCSILLCHRKWFGNLEILGESWLLNF